MTATIIDGNPIAERLRADIARDAAAFKSEFGYQPGLGVVLVGDDPASQMYVRMKRRACESVGVISYAHILPSDATQTEVEAAVRTLNDDPKVHGILVQLPLPKHIDEDQVLRIIDFEKDADGAHPLNIGLLAMKGREPLYIPATPAGIMVILKDIGVELSGANAVVIGRSNIVGMPIALLLMEANATVTMCHSRTKNLQAHLKDADVVIAAVGRAGYVKGDWLKPGCVVIDVGTNKIDDPTAEKGYRYVGDVELESAREVARAITKVPGGVGPLTITMLIQQTVKAAWRRARK
ncbi:MAG: bifunctional 5,10-methylenetetrahydrofolate dehydrogenase/5,10-methenyltetrahydrofolate cyclohydrolase [Chloroflexi bacterium]|nr:bifunctional 5,10-methylenetetrahydrofolate dehydrogenase/5,10-methenyltetrahydrofolate cyclohydrolase [Chloroflexota bacterium]